MARIKLFTSTGDTTTTTGTGALTGVGVAPTGYLIPASAIPAAVANNDETTIRIQTSDGLTWEVCRTVITLSASVYTYSRGTLIASSTGSRISFAAGTKDVLFVIDSTLLAEEVLTAKGDIASHTGTIIGRLGVGADGAFLNADSAETTGQKWSLDVDLKQQVKISGDISPSQITANQNDYNPTSLSTASVLRLNTDASRNVTGLQGGADGRIMVIYNVGSFDLVLKNEDAASTAAYRFTLGADLTLKAGHGTTLIYDATTSRWRMIAYSSPTPASYQATPTNPTGTTSTTGVMMGLAGAITPTSSGKVLIIISGNAKTSVASAGVDFGIRYGTGTAPTNGAALTGTDAGGLPRFVASSTTERGIFSANAVVSGLTVGTAYWIDLRVAAVAAGTATVENISISVIEL